MARALDGCVTRSSSGMGAADMGRTASALQPPCAVLVLFFFHVRLRGSLLTAHITPSPCDSPDLPPAAPRPNPEAACPADPIVTYIMAMDKFFQTSGVRRLKELCGCTASIKRIAADSADIIISLFFLECNPGSPRYASLRRKTTPVCPRADRRAASQCYFPRLKILKMSLKGSSSILESASVMGSRVLGA